MKVLMVHPHDIKSSLEPWTIRIVKLAEELAAKGHEVKLAYFPLAPLEKYHLGSIEVVPLDRIISPLRLLQNTRLLYSLSRWADVVHFQKCHFYSVVPTLLAAFLAGRPTHYDWDDWEEQIFLSSIQRPTTSTFVTGVSFKLLERWLPFLADTMSVASDALRTLAVKRGAAPANVFLVPVGADLKMFKVCDKQATTVRERYGLERDLLVLYHGQLHSCQYVTLFLNAIQELYRNDHCQGVRFLILGIGSEFDRLRLLSEDLGIADRVIFTGYVPHEQIPEYIAVADICVVPFEDNVVTRCKSPLKIVEYLASGKPIVASDVGEARNMVQDVGLLVAPGDAKAFAKGIKVFLDREDLRQESAIKARRRAETKYNWTVSAESLERAYRVSVP